MRTQCHIEQFESLPNFTIWYTGTCNIEIKISV